MAFLLNMCNNYDFVKFCWRAKGFILGIKRQLVIKTWKHWFLRVGRKVQRVPWCSRILSDFFLVTGNCEFSQTNKRAETERSWVFPNSLLLIRGKTSAARLSSTHLEPANPNPNPAIIWPTAPTSALPLWWVRHLILHTSLPLPLQPTLRARRDMKLLPPMLQTRQVFRC